MSAPTAIAPLNIRQTNVYSKAMRTHALKPGLALLMLCTSVLGQLPQATVKSGKPALKRDRTQRVLYPKIIQLEDERSITSDLVEMLQPMHGGARRRAIRALGRIGYPSGLAALMDILISDQNPENRDPEMRALAAFSLGQIQNQHAVSVLIERLDPAIEKSALVRARAVEASAQMESNKLAVAALGGYGVKGIADAIVRLLPSTNGPVSSDARLVGSI